MIEQCKKEVQEKQGVLSKLAIEFVKEQIIERINKTVEQNGDITVKLHESGRLSDLKKEMNHLIDEKVAEDINNGFERFLHDDFRLIREKRDYELNEELFSLYKNVISGAGKLLREYGYTVIVGEYEKGKHNFLNKIGTGPKPDNDELVRVQSEWIDMCRNCMKVMDEIEAEKKADIAKRAKKLWDNA